MRFVAASCCAFVLLCCFALADDFTTSDGKEYKDATVRRVEADGIVITTKSGGLLKLYFAELPKEVQQRYPVSLETQYAALQKRESELLQELGSANEAKIHKKRRRAKHFNEMNTMTAQIPALHKELDDVRASMKEIKRQLQQAQQPQQQSKQ